MFTLTPVGDPLSIPAPLTQYQCTFHWLPKHSPSSATIAGGASVLDCGTQLTEAEDEQLSSTAIFNTEIHRLIRSGDLITLSTDDPQNKPLPHPDLLRLHAALARVVRCAAQAYDGDEGEAEEWGEEGREAGEDMAARNQDNERNVAQPICHRHHHRKAPFLGNVYHNN